MSWSSANATLSHWIAPSGTDRRYVRICHGGTKKGLPIDVITRYGPDEDYAVSVMAISELRHGIRRADGPRRRARREHFLADVLSLFNILPVDLAIALRVGDIDAELKSQGLGIPLPGIIIASTALELGYAVATFNLKDFKRIPGLQIAEPRAGT